MDERRTDDGHPSRSSVLPWVPARKAAMGPARGIVLTCRTAQVCCARPWAISSKPDGYKVATRTTPLGQVRGYSAEARIHTTGTNTYTASILVGCILVRLKQVQARHRPVSPHPVCSRGRCRGFLSPVYEQTEISTSRALLSADRQCPASDMRRMHVSANGVGIDKGGGSELRACLDGAAPAARVPRVPRA